MYVHTVWMWLMYLKGVDVSWMHFDMLRLWDKETKTETEIKIFFFIKVHCNAASNMNMTETFITSWSPTYFEPHMFRYN